MGVVWGLDTTSFMAKPYILRIICFQRICSKFLGFWHGHGYFWPSAFRNCKKLEKSCFSKLFEPTTEIAWHNIFAFYKLFFWIILLKSVYFERTCWCLQFFQKTNLKISIFSLAYWGRNFSFVLGRIENIHKIRLEDSSVWLKKIELLHQSVHLSELVSIVAGWASQVF